MRFFFPQRRLLSISTMKSQSLSEFLFTNRQRYFDALKADKPRDWTVVVGNEAGDLDTSACSLAYSYLSTILFNNPTIALLRTARSDFHLRAENDYAFGLAELRDDHSDLLCIDDIPRESFSQVLRSSFALVDHNRLDRMFTGIPTPLDAFPRVVSIIDHHTDEGFHTDAQGRTIVVPVGSCASLVTKHFSPHWPVDETPVSPDVATLLLTAILIDTNGLRKNGKAVQIDYEAVEFLLPRSNLNLSLNLTGPVNLGDQVKIADIPRKLETLKSSISHLSSRDLLRRDYKEYNIIQNEPFKTIAVGIASVPLNLKTWLKLHPSPEFWDALDEWLEERHLDVLAVLFSYRSEKKNKHKRQTLWLVKQGLDELRRGLFEGLEEREELGLEMKGLKKVFVEGVERTKSGDVVTKAGGRARVWRQLRVDATRKIVAPLAKSIIERL